MLEFQGNYARAKVFTDKIDEDCIKQIYGFLNNKAFKGLKIRIMPDVHKGKNAVIGFTSNIIDKVVPNVVGVDIGCGVLTAEIKDKEINFEKLDKIIKEHIPSGTNIRNKEHAFSKRLKLEELKCKKEVDIKRALLSCSTLGGGNHFIEVNRSEKGIHYISIHTGSRHLGKEVAELYQNIAYRELLMGEKGDKELAYLTGESLENYLNDMNIVQEYASINREAILKTIINKMGFRKVRHFHTTHNYIDMDNNILRKGAISAKKGEEVVIPISMKDGMILGTGKGNEDWNFSACHGAGRVLSRSEARENISLEEFKISMKDVWSTTVTENTLDESPFAYKKMEDILPYIKDTVDIVDIIKPVYNFKNTN